MTAFDTIIAVDWSARSRPSPPRPTADAIWIAVAEDGSATTHYHRTRHDAMAALEASIAHRLDAGRRVLAGFDFPLGYPAGAARAFTGSDDPFALWSLLAERVDDAPDNANTRFQVANAINAGQPGVGPFWGRPAALDLPHLPARGTERHGHGLAEHRACERLTRAAQSCWKLFTTGSVGSQTLVGLPRLHALRSRFGADCAVWPFEAPDRPLVLAEIYPSLLAAEVAAARRPGDILDEVQVRVLAHALSAMSAEGTLPAAFAAAGTTATEEGWILGVGAEAALRAAVPR